MLFRSERPSPSQGAQQRETENKFTPNSSDAPDKLPPRAECSPKSFHDWWKDTLLYLNSCYAKPPSDGEYIKKIWMMLDPTWRDILTLDQYKCSLKELHHEIEKEILRAYPTYRRRCSFFLFLRRHPRRLQKLQDKC